MNDNHVQKTIVITGGTGGIGRYSAIGLAKTGARVVVTGRNQERGEASVQEIKSASGNDDVHLAIGDVAIQESIHSLADDLIKRFDKIDVLVNNAGMFATELAHTNDGFELNFAINVAAPYTLTRLLAPALEAAKPARVLNVTGGMPSGKVDITNLQAEKSFRGMSSYSHSKRIMDTMSLALAREMEPRGIYVNVIYPGAASTSMTQGVKPSNLPWFARPLFPLFQYMTRDDGGKGAQKAARSTIWGANAPETEGKSGQYFDTNCKPAKFHASIQDSKNQEAVISVITKTLDA
ncbi:MAG: SDR family NAD(P)-dependent oxidoreductase [Chloroflexota bacterium]